MNLESALVINLRETIRWESAMVTSTGTLHPVNPDLPFNALDYQRRDRELAFRDLITAAAVVDANIHVSDVWHFKGPAPILEGPVNKSMPHAPSEMGLANSQMRHVRYTSVPADAFSVADRDLYGRDVLVYDVLARACQQLFAETSPLAAVSSSGSVPGVQAWSLAEGAPARADINEALPLNRELFKLPDMNLADRDNQMAGYVSRLVQAIKNPFAHAERLYISVTGSGASDREAEVYNLVSESATERVWVGDPAIEGRNRFIYYPLTGLLEWRPPTADTFHIPQIKALVIPGVLPGQLLNTLPEVPSPNDAQFWRLKAGQLTPAGTSYTDVCHLKFTATDEVTGGVTQITSASMTVPDNLTITLPVSTPLPTGAYRISILTKPCSVVEVIGAQNSSGVGGENGGADYASDVASGDIQPIAYLVYDGDGIVYNGTGYAPGSTFTGVAGVTTYTSLNGSKVRQYSCVWSIPLSPGAWTFTVDYANIGAPTTGFGVRATYTETGKNTLSAIDDTVPLNYRDANSQPLAAGTVKTSPPVALQITQNSEFELPIYWTFGDGQLSIRKLRFERSDLTQTRYSVNGTLTGATRAAVADVVGTANQPDVILLDYGTVVSTVPPLTLNLSYTEEAGLPLLIKQVQLQAVGTLTPTPLTDRMQGWRQECLDRAARAVQQSYQEMLRHSSGTVPTFNAYGTWDQLASEDYIAFLEVKHPRIRTVEQVGTNAIEDGRQYSVRSGTVDYGSVSYSTGQVFYGIEASGTLFSGGGIVDQVGAFKKAGPGHIGKPGLLPLGLYPDADGTVRVNTSGSLFPVVATMQGWMIDAGLYAAAPEFWQPDTLETA